MLPLMFRSDETAQRVLVLFSGTFCPLPKSVFCHSAHDVAVCLGSCISFGVKAIHNPKLLQAFFVYNAAHLPDTPQKAKVGQGKAMPPKFRPLLLFGPLLVRYDLINVHTVIYAAESR
jgi:hypothetical protein